MAIIRTPGMHDPGPLARRRLLRLPFLYFGASLAVALVLALANSQLGSLNLLPGETLWLPSLCLIALYALALAGQLHAYGLQAPTHRRIRHLLLGVSTLLACPVIALLIAPGLNGLGGWHGEVSTTAIIARIETTTVKGKNSLYYYAYLEAGNEGNLPAGRYFMGTYAHAWSPDEGTSLPSIRQIDVRYRIGLLGARTLLQARPV